MDFLYVSEFINICIDLIKNHKNIREFKIKLNSIARHRLTKISCSKPWAFKMVCALFP